MVPKIIFRSKNEQCYIQFPVNSLKLKQFCCAQTKKNIQDLQLFIYPADLSLCLALIIYLGTFISACLLTWWCAHSLFYSFHQFSDPSSKNVILSLWNCASLWKNNNNKRWALYSFLSGKAVKKFKLHEQTYIVLWKLSFGNSTIILRHQTS